MTAITIGHDSGPPRIIRRPVSRWFPYGICSDKKLDYYRRLNVKCIILYTEVINAQKRQIAGLKERYPETFLDRVLGWLDRI